MNSGSIAILGAGMAGFGAAYELFRHGVRADLYEARPTHGGHTSTHIYDDGFTFDEGPHISFTSDPRIQDLFARSIGGKFEQLKAYVNNYWNGHWIKHPAQVNLFGLPDNVIVSCIKDFVEATYSDVTTIENYEDWLRKSFGHSFAETFPMPYTRKYHTTDAKNLTTDWLGPRLYRPKLDEILIGALKREPLDVHYVSNFRYPSVGGFVTYLDHFLPMANINLDHRVVEIDPDAKLLSFRGGKRVPYKELISSIPLPELVRLITNVPEQVRAAADMLACTQVVLVNIGLKGRIETPAQWTYFYDEDISFARLSYPSTFASSMAPEGFCSVQAEVYFSRKWKPMTTTPAEQIDRVIDGLLGCGIIKDRSDIVHRSVIFAPYANIIFDHDRPTALKIVHDYLDGLGIAYCGRYGDWGYMWTDESFKSGERAARIALEQLNALPILPKVDLC